LAAFLGRGWWLPQVQHLIAAGESDASHSTDDSQHSNGHDEHAVHDHADHDEAASLTLSEQGRKNIGLQLVTIEPRDFERTIAVPAMLVERPGRTKISVSAPMTGIVTRIYPIRGEAVVPGSPLFDLRLTHEDLVEKQSALLRALEELDVVKREVARLKEVTASGAVAGKRLLEREYEQQKIEAVIRAERQALRLHGLTDEQIASIVDRRRLLQSLTISAPPLTDCVSCTERGEFLQVANLAVTLGQHVTTGDRLVILTDHCELYVEGKAFEQDATALNQAANQGVAVTAIIEGNSSGHHEVPGLHILYVENTVERDSRALKFYASLPNELVRNEKTSDGRRFIGWRYKSGQRVELLVPIERWEKRIVLPVEAVIQDGAEWFVYQQVGDHFDRRPVHVEYRDQRFAVIESDGTLFPGDVVAAAGAYQIHLALKNKAGQSIDTHAGHHH
jgi:multidrug efflux pump subunit AcrA (membrane-fusion protein)